MLKTVKSKVIAGALVVGLVSGGGAVLGATDAGAQLKSWYDGQFKKSSELVSAEVANYGAGKAEEWTTEYIALKDKTTKSLTDKGEFVTGVTNTGVNNRASEHIDKIKIQTEEIEKHLVGQFKILSDFAADLINESGQKALDNATVDLTNHAGAVGTEVKEQMEKEVHANTEQAIKDLEDTIAAAKSDLQTQLDTNTDLTIVEIKGLIDAKINELRTKITALNNKLIISNEKIITMTSKALLLAAEKELDDIVAGINK